ncbi:MAG: hypothetical protein ACREDP_22695, partial [Bradyrhizobium sp.]
MVALSAYVAVQSAAIFGVSALQIAVAAERGEALSFAIATVWVMSVTLGLYWAVVGYRATLTHVDLEGMSAALSIGAIALCFWILRYSGFTSEIGRAVTVAFLANNVTNMCLQLRGILPRKQRRYQQHSPDPELHLLIEELAAERDRLVPV